jgi:predicted nucleic acid-binding protein
MIVVDTSAWYADIIPEDNDHQAARAWRTASRERLLTTDRVLA